MLCRAPWPPPPRPPSHPLPRLPRPAPPDRGVPDRGATRREEHGAIRRASPGGPCPTDPWWWCSESASGSSLSEARRTRCVGQVAGSQQRQRVGPANAPGSLCCPSEVTCSRCDMSRYAFACNSFPATLRCAPLGVNCGTYQSDLRQCAVRAPAPSRLSPPNYVGRPGPPNPFQSAFCTAVRARRVGSFALGAGNKPI